MDNLFIFIDVFTKNPLTVTLAVLGVLCVVAAIIGKFPMDIKGTRMALLASFGIVLIFAAVGLAIVLAWILTPSQPAPQPTTTAQGQSTPPVVQGTPVSVGSVPTATPPECTPPTGLIHLQDNTNPPWSGDIWGSRNMISFIGNVGEVDTSRPTFGDFQIWIDPCSVNPFYKGGARFCPVEKTGINCDSTVIQVPGKTATTIKLNPNTGRWGLGQK